MAWTAPRVWTVGQVVLAAELNVDIQENMLVLSTHAHGGAAGDGDDQLSGVDDIIFDDVSAPAAPGAGDSRLYFVSGVPHARVGGSGADHPLAPDAKGEILSHDGTIPAQLTVGSNQQHLEADSSESTGLKWASANTVRARKSGDETISSDSTLSNDSDLSVAVAANTGYFLTCFLEVNSGATPDIKVKWSLPSGATLDWVAEFKGATRIWHNEGTTHAYGTSGSDEVVTIVGYLRITTAGTCVLQWAQDVSDPGNTTVKAGSWLVLTTAV